jgi:hypothetical protein
MLPVLSHNLSRCFPVTDIRWHDVGDGWLSGCDGKILRALDDGSMRSALVRLQPGHAGVAIDAASSTVQGFVLSGTITLGGTVLVAGGFFVIPSGADLPGLVSEVGAELIVIFDDAAIGPARAAEAVLLTSAYDVEPIVPVIDGVRLDGFARRVLWEDPDTGADTRLLTVPAGFEGKGPNWHPVHEEIFCLEGDIGPDDSRLMVPGTYLHNPAYGVHGYHEHSKGGATILEWHDGRWAVNFVS